MTNTWMNADGLYLKYGTANAGPNKAGEYRTFGPDHLIEVEIDLTALTATDGATILSDQVFFPKSARISRVEVFAKTAATGSGAVLNIGLVKSDRTTEIDFNGLVAAIPLANMDTTGETTVLRKGDTYAGALIGTTSGSNVGYLCADYDTAAFTAGVVLVRIYYQFPT